MKELIKRELRINAVPIAWFIIRTLGARFIPKAYNKAWKAFAIRRMR